METGKEQKSEKKEKLKILNYLMLVIWYKLWKGKKYCYTVEGRLVSESEQGTCWPINNNWMCDHG